MKYNIWYVLCLPALLTISGCIEEFDPNIQDYSDLLVVDGRILKGDSLQKVTISRSTNVSEKEFIPVSGCEVNITDSRGNNFIFLEKNEGEYLCRIPEEELHIDFDYRLAVKTPNGEEYQSENVTLLEASPVDSIYFEMESFQSSSEEYSEGLQFYTDLMAPDTIVKYFGWQVEETWEMHTSYEIDGKYKKGSLEFPTHKPISDSVSVCWGTNYVSEIYISSTQNLISKEKKKIPLNYLPGTSYKSSIKYSLLVKHFSLSEKAYKYWEYHSKTSKESGGLYQSQPPQSISNIKNVNNPSETVLGFFWASSLTERRIFVQGPIFHSLVDCAFFECYPPFCNLLTRLEGMGIETVFLVAIEFSVANPDVVRYWGIPYNQLCIDCTSEGGTNIKPDFWK